MNQTLFTSDIEYFCLNALREGHSKAGFKGDCIVIFEPKTYPSIVCLQGFVPVGYDRPFTIGEVGMCEVFHFVPSSPIKYYEVEE